MENQSVSTQMNRGEDRGQLALSPEVQGEITDFLSSLAWASLSAPGYELCKRLVRDAEIGNEQDETLSAFIPPTTSLSIC